MIAKASSPLRTHCSTCGRQTKPQRWAYCSKACERNRRGLLDDCGEMENGTDEWLFVLHDERLRLRDQMSMAPRYQRDAIAFAIAANEAREAAVRAEIAALARSRMHQ